MGMGKEGCMLLFFKGILQVQATPVQTDITYTQVLTCATIVT